MSKFSIDDLLLLMRSLEREYAKDSTKFVTANEHMAYYPNHPNNIDKRVYVRFINSDRVILSILVDSDNMWVHRPWFLSVRAFDESLAIWNRIMGRSEMKPEHTSMESRICEAIPSAKDIIAEQTLLGSDPS